MSTQHTPGEWTVPHFANDDTQCNCLAVLNEGYCGSICLISVDNGLPIDKGGNDCPPLEEAKANARLIAAAPDLLHTCKEFLSAFNGTPLSMMIPKHMQLLRDAIAKATQPTHAGETAAQV